MRALLPEFNAVILKLAPAFEARPMAPATMADLLRLDIGAALPVWDGASDRTVYADPHVNHAFRAWHDARHLTTAGAFDLEGEARVCAAQWADVLALYPRAPQSWRALLEAEVIGQAAHFAATGEFPADQISFVREALAYV